MMFAESRRVSVDHVLLSYSSYEIAEWKAYYQLYPMPQMRSDLRSGNISALIYNANRSQDSDPLTASAFIFSSQEEADKTLDERVASTRAAIAMYKL